MSDPCRPILFSVEEYVYIILHIFSVFLGTYVYLFHPRCHSAFDPCNLCTFEPTDCTFFCQKPHLTLFSAFLHAPPCSLLHAAAFRCSCFGQRGASLYLLIYRVYLFLSICRVSLSSVRFMPLPRPPLMQPFTVHVSVNGVDHCTF